MKKLKSQERKNNIFLADVQDIKDIKFERIIGKLPDPTVKPKGLFTIVYEFKSKIDVYEK